MKLFTRLVFMFYGMVSGFSEEFYVIAEAIQSTYNDIIEYDPDPRIKLNTFVNNKELVQLILENDIILQQLFDIQDEFHKKYD